MEDIRHTQERSSTSAQRTTDCQLSASCLIKPDAGAPACFSPPLRGALSAGLGGRSDDWSGSSGRPAKLLGMVKKQDIKIPFDFREKIAVLVAKKSHTGHIFLIYNLGFFPYSVMVKILDSFLRFFQL
jgi:hypothetical protein